MKIFCGYSFTQTLTFPLLLKSHGIDLESTQYNIIMFQVQKEVVGIQLETRHSIFVKEKLEINAMITPISLMDTWSLGMSQIWNDWEPFMPEKTRKGKEPMNSSVPVSKPLPNLEMKIIVWNVRGASNNAFVPHAWDVVRLNKLLIFIFSK